MVEKYRGILPPNSIWYQINSKKLSLILENSELSGKTEPSFRKYVFEHKSDTNTEIMVPKNQIEKFEQILKEFDEKIITLY